MTILSVGYPLFPVAQDASGGAEQILLLLTRELSEQGCESYVVAARGSRVNGRLLETPTKAGEIVEEDRVRARRAHLEAIEQAIRVYRIDLIHFHGLDFHTYVPETNIPMLATLHLPLSWYPEHIFRQSRVKLNCVSHAQAADTGLPVVLNGVDVDRYRPVTRPGDYVLWLGRICPEKGVHLALDAAKEAGLRMKVAGPVHPFATHQEYFKKEVQPRLDGDREYIGPVDGAKKERLLAEARCLAVTSLVAETCSLVTMEALSAGTPVVALNSGALPEVLQHGVTGFVAESPDEIGGLLRKVDCISRNECRKYAQQNFSARRMADDYLALYRRVFGIRTAPQESLYDSSPRKKFQAV